MVQKLLFCGETNVVDENDFSGHKIPIHMCSKMYCIYPFLFPTTSHNMPCPRKPMLCRHYQCHSRRRTRRLKLLRLRILRHQCLTIALVMHVDPIIVDFNFMLVYPIGFQWVLTSNTWHTFLMQDKSADLSNEDGLAEDATPVQIAHAIDSCKLVPWLPHVSTQCWKSSGWSWLRAWAIPILSQTSGFGKTGRMIIPWRSTTMEAGWYLIVPSNSMRAK